MRYRSCGKPLLACSFVSRIRNQTGFVSIEIFQTLLVLKHFFFSFLFLFLSTFAVAMLWFAVLFDAFEFCDFHVSGNLTNQTSLLLLCSSFLLKKRDHF